MQQHLFSVTPIGRQQVLCFRFYNKCWGRDYPDIFLEKK